ncbi:hypothetical protein [Bacillus sp. T33-2]|uniref:hypothetical protein n=1 Tax=Bacillus sp. T33-2 TaxID=2054168 RepID=UPI000C781C6E|nr:hypothetical protein [Bacillus sp. T33-2]PLR96773.1 hypothetical protein CVD19_10385 [Bacillus sp. T33-2]
MNVYVKYILISKNKTATGKISKVTGIKNRVTGIKNRVTRIKNRLTGNKIPVTGKLVFQGLVIPACFEKKADEA